VTVLRIAGFARDGQALVEAAAEPDAAAIDVVENLAVVSGVAPEAVENAVENAQE
jgi:hypothetical protein